MKPISSTQINSDPVLCSTSLAQAPAYNSIDTIDLQTLKSLGLTLVMTHILCDGGLYVSVPLIYVTVSGKTDCVCIVLHKCHINRVLEGSLEVI